MPRIHQMVGVFTCGEQGHERSSSPIFQSHLQAAVAAVPADPREGHGPTETRTMPRHKVIAAWLHCTRLPLAEIAKGATVLGGVKVSYSIVGKWRTEGPFRALIEKAQAEMIEALNGAYDEGWDHNSHKTREAFERFRQELRTFSGWIRAQVLIHVKEEADQVEREVEEALKGPVSDLPENIEALGIGRNVRSLEETALYTDLVEDTGGEWWEAYRRTVRELIPLSLLVERSSELFGAAEKENNWEWARGAFEHMTELASAYAKQRDATVQAALKRRKSKGDRSKGRRVKAGSR